MTMIGNFLRDRAGASAVEFAIVANLFVALLLGGFAIGYVFVVKSDLEQSITAAERYALINEEDDTELAAIIRGKLATYDGSKIALKLSRGSTGGVDYVKADISYAIDLGIDFIFAPLSISSSRIFPT